MCIFRQTGAASPACLDLSLQASHRVAGLSLAQKAPQSFAQEHGSASASYWAIVQVVAVLQRCAGQVSSLIRRLPPGCGHMSAGCGVREAEQQTSQLQPEVLALLRRMPDVWNRLLDMAVRVPWQASLRLNIQYKGLASWCFSSSATACTSDLLLGYASSSDVTDTPADEKAPTRAHTTAPPCDCLNTMSSYNQPTCFLDISARGLKSQRPYCTHSIVMK